MKDKYGRVIKIGHIAVGCARFGRSGTRLSVGKISNTGENFATINSNDSGVLNLKTIIKYSKNIIILSEDNNEFFN